VEIFDFFLTFVWELRACYKLIFGFFRFPEPQLPELWLVPYCFSHALAICSVTFPIFFSQPVNFRSLWHSIFQCNFFWIFKSVHTIFRVKLFANKFHYSVSLSHELYAIGFGSMLSGFFPTYPTSTALARTVVLVESGARTQVRQIFMCFLIFVWFQLSSGFSALLVLFVILFVGPLFEPLPQVGYNRLSCSFDVFSVRPFRYYNCLIEDGVWQFQINWTPVARWQIRLCKSCVVIFNL
jgi:hypothetical protein